MVGRDESIHTRQISAAQQHKDIRRYVDARRIGVRTKSTLNLKSTVQCLRRAWLRDGPGLGMRVVSHLGPVLQHVNTARAILLSQPWSTAGSP